MPRNVSHGWARIQFSSVSQLCARPESTAPPADEKNCTEPDSRSQYCSARAGKSRHTTRVPARPPSAILPRGTRLRLSRHNSTIATITLSTDAREYESTSAAENTAAPNPSAFDDSGRSDFGIEKATAIITRKKAQKLPSVLA